MSPLYPNSISADQGKLLQILGEAQIGTLVGGTALALQLGHRKSYDLDFVSQEMISEELVSSIQQAVSDYELTQRLQSKTQYTAYAGRIKITLFQDPAAFLHGSVTYEQAQLASIEDIFSTKLYILGKRATWRDYCDIALCLDQKKVNLKQGIAEARQRYKVADRWILEPLTYFEDVELMPIEWLGKHYSDDEVKQILERAASEYVKDLLNE